MKTEREELEEIWGDEYWEYVHRGLFIAFGLWLLAVLAASVFDSFYDEMTRGWVMDGVAFIFFLCGVGWFLGYRDSNKKNRAHTLLLAFPAAALAAAMTMFMGTAKVEKRYRDGTYEYVDPSTPLRCQAAVEMATITYLVLAALYGGNRIYSQQQWRKHKQT